MRRGSVLFNVALHLAWSLQMPCPSISLVSLCTVGPNPVPQPPLLTRNTSARGRDTELEQRPCPRPQHPCPVWLPSVLPLRTENWTGFVYTAQGSPRGPSTPPHPTLALLTLLSVFSCVPECLATLAEGELRGEGPSQGALPLHRHPAPYLTLVPEAWGV